MKNITEFIIESNDVEITKCAKYLGKVFSDSNNGQKSFSLFMNKLYKSMNNDNPDELFWNLLKNDSKENGWTIDRKMD